MTRYIEDFFRLGPDSYNGMSPTGDSDSDWLPAFTRAATYQNLDDLARKEPIIIGKTRAQYNLSNYLPVGDCWFRGTSESWRDQVVLYFDQGTDGIRIHASTGGSTSSAAIQEGDSTLGGAAHAIFENLEIKGRSSVDEGTVGIAVYLRTTLRNCTLRYWGAYGVHVHAWQEGDRSAYGGNGNANRSFFEQCYFNNCGSEPGAFPSSWTGYATGTNPNRLRGYGAALMLEGDSANVITIDRCDFTNNDGWPIFDISFLGPTLISGCHCSGNHIQKLAALTTLHNAATPSTREWYTTWTRSAVANDDYFTGGVWAGGGNTIGRIEAHYCETTPYDGGTIVVVGPGYSVDGLMGGRVYPRGGSAHQDGETHRGPASFEHPAPASTTGFVVLNAEDVIDSTTGEAQESTQLFSFGNSGASIEESAIEVGFHPDSNDANYGKYTFRRGGSDSEHALWISGAAATELSGRVGFPEGYYLDEAYRTHATQAEVTAGAASKIVEAARVDGGLVYPSAPVLATADHWRTVEGTLRAIHPLPLRRGFDAISGRANSTIQFTEGTRDFRLLVSNGGYSFASDGAAYKKTSQSQSIVTITDVEGMHWIYFNGSGTAVESVNPNEATVLDILFRYAPVAAIYWDATNNLGLVMDERHTQGIDPELHKILHRGTGARLSRTSSLGFAAITVTVDGSGNSAGSATISVAGSTLIDEDIEHPATGPFTQLPVLYLEGSSAAPNIRWLTATDYPLVYGGHGLTAGARAGYNLLSGGTWSLAEASSSNFVLMHIFRTNITGKPYIAVTGQAQHTTVANARAAALLEIYDLAHGVLPFPELKAVGTLIAETSNAYSNAPKARWRSTDLGEAYVDYRREQD